MGIAPKKGEERTAEDYFLAGKSLPWWAIGASLIAANISAEQFIGMSGSGFAIGLAIASYEWMAAITLIIVGKFFLPIFIEKRIYTIPEFVEHRFSKSLKTILAVFWISLFIFVNLTSVLFLGAKAIDTIVGVGDGSLMLVAILGLALFAAAYSLWGGLSAVAWTDVVQVALLILGGLVTTAIALTKLTPDGGIIKGFQHLYTVVPEKFSMILSKGEIITPTGVMPVGFAGLSVLIGGCGLPTFTTGVSTSISYNARWRPKALERARRVLCLLHSCFDYPPYCCCSRHCCVCSQPSGRCSMDPTFIGADGQILNDSAAPWLIVVPYRLG